MIAFPLTWLAEATPETSGIELSQPAKANSEVSHGESENLKTEPKRGPTFVQQGPAELVKAWEKLAANYNDRGSHESFLKLTWQAKDLGFASRQYQRMLELNPEDEIAMEMRDRILALTTAPVQMARSQLRQYLVGRLGFSGIMIGFSLGLMAMGYIFPLLRNIVGVGAALFFFSVALRIYMRPD